MLVAYSVARTQIDDIFWWRNDRRSGLMLVMLAENPEGSGRKCVCCGAPAATRSLCACWEHWMVLPEDLRSELLRSFSRDEFANYRRALLSAVEIWRHAGVWRVPGKAQAT